MASIPLPALHIQGAGDIPSPLNSLKDAALFAPRTMLQAGKVGLDALAYLGSPASGIATSIVGRPTEKTTGIRREIPGEIVASLLPVGPKGGKLGSSAWRAILRWDGKSPWRLHAKLSLE